MRQFPIKVISIVEQKPLINLVDKIITAKKQNPSTYTTDLVNQIDQLGYPLYNFTEEGIKIVEGERKMPTLHSHTITHKVVLFLVVFVNASHLPTPPANTKVKACQGARLAERTGDSVAKLIDNEINKQKSPVA